MGLVEALTDFCNKVKSERLLQNKDSLTERKVNEILSLAPRIEKVAVKDIKLRTFITQDIGRDDLVAHVYDVTYGIIRTGTDTLVVLDDSIVRGTTLRQSIIAFLTGLAPNILLLLPRHPNPLS
jgi:amidophosphoribosyltransferase